MLLEKTVLSIKMGVVKLVQHRLDQGVKLDKVDNHAGITRNRPLNR
jgi:hypothetical protein